MTETKRRTTTAAAAGATIAGISGVGAQLRRAYSREFTAHKNARRRGFYIDRVPVALHDAVRAKAKRDGVAVRSLVLAFLAKWAGAN